MLNHRRKHHSVFIYHAITLLIAISIHVARSRINIAKQRSNFSFYWCSPNGQNSTIIIVEDFKEMLTNIGKTLSLQKYLPKKKKKILLTNKG